MTAQLDSQTASMDNPLGRVLSAYDEAKGADVETVELKLHAAALKEMPDLTKGLLFILLHKKSPIKTTTGLDDAIPTLEYSSNKAFDSSK